MSKIIIKFLLDFLDGLLGDFTNNSLLNLAEQPFAIEKEMTNLGINQFESIFKIFVSIGLTLIVVKFLKKGFDMYVLWIDGDPNAEPLQLVIGFIKAIAIALTFTVLYQWFSELIISLINDILTKIGLYGNIDPEGFNKWFTGVNSVEQVVVSTVTGYVIFFIMYIMLYIKLIGLGFEMLVLRIGLPLACTGMMDSDNGVFKVYAQKILQVSITVLVQIIMMKVSLSLLLAGHTIWGLAAVCFALRTPSALREFLFAGSSGGVVNNIYSVARLSQMAMKSVVV